MVPFADSLSLSEIGKEGMEKGKHGGRRRLDWHCYTTGKRVCSANYDVILSANKGNEGRKKKELLEEKLILLVQTLA